MSENVRVGLFKKGLTTAEKYDIICRTPSTVIWAYVTASRHVLAYIQWHWCECENSKYANGEMLEYFVCRALRERYGSMDYALTQIFKVDYKTARLMIQKSNSADWEEILNLFLPSIESE